jgi:hypothetical protein
MVDITVPDANPIVVAILNWFFLGCVGYLVIEQKQKALAGAIYTIVLSAIGIGFFIPVVAAVDGYQVAAKLSQGETVDSHYCAIKWLTYLPLWREL